MSSRLIHINEYISYLPATENPLSADVGIVRTKAGTFFFDVGSSDEAFELIKNTEGPRHIVISHFHTDHAGNLKRLLDEGIIKLTSGSQTGDSVSSEYYLARNDTLTLGSFTHKHYGCGANLRSLVNIETETLSGEKVIIQAGPLPSSHAKGSLYLMISNEYLFLGDGTYWNIRPDKKFYNVQILKQEIDTLKGLPATKALLSHSTPFVQSMKKVLDKLERIYGFREENNSEIDMTFLGGMR